MFGKIENGILKEMPSSGVDESGCLFVVAADSEVYALANGYKKLVESEYPNDGNEYVLKYVESDTELSQLWELLQ